MEARNRTLPDWLTKVRTHQITLPRFQRFEAWSHKQVTALLDNVLQELPAGAVLVLEVGEGERFHSRPVAGAPNAGERVTEQLLDGQQRITALWRALNDAYQDRSYFVVLEDDEPDANVPYVRSFARWYRNGAKYPLWLDDPKKTWEKKMIPVPLLRPDDEDAVAALDTFAEDAANEDRYVEREITRTATQLRGLFAKFNVPFLSLPSTTPDETALNVFIQMNTSASPLTAYDIVVAQVEAVAGTSLHELTDELRQRVPLVNEYANAEDLALAVSALLQDRVPNKSTYLGKGFSSMLVEVWDDTISGISRAVSFLDEERVFDSRRLPTDVVLYPLSALWAHVHDGLDAEGEARRLLRKYIWRAFCTDRYERTSATRALVDFRQMVDLLRGRGDTTPEVFDDDRNPMPTKEELIYSGWPVRRDRLARAILAVSLKAGGLDFADGSQATRDNLKKREYHHIFPNAWLKRAEYDESKIFCSLNCALVSWRTNRKISDKPPSQYIHERMEGSNLGEEEIRHRMQSHLIPYESIRSEDYGTFLSQRADLVLARMTDLCSGGVSAH